MTSKITIEYDSKGHLVSLTHEGVNQAELIGMLDIARVVVLNNVLSNTKKLIQDNNKKPKTK